MILSSVDLERDNRNLQRNLQRANEEAAEAQRRATELAQQLADLQLNRSGASSRPAVAQEEPGISRGPHLATFSGRYEANLTFTDWLLRFEEHARARRWEGDRRADILPT